MKKCGRVNRKLRELKMEARRVERLDAFSMIPLLDLRQQNPEYGVLRDKQRRACTGQ